MKVSKFSREASKPAQGVANAVKKFMPPSFQEEMLACIEQACAHAHNGNTEALQSLLMHPHNGVFINKRGLKGFTPLFLAARSKSQNAPATLAALLHCPNLLLNVPSGDMLETPLHVVSSCECLAMLLVKGADFTIKDRSGKRPQDNATPAQIAVYDRFCREGAQGLVDNYPRLITFNLIPKESLISVLADKLIGKPNEGKLILTWRLRESELTQKEGWKKSKGFLQKSLLPNTTEYTDFIQFFNAKLDGKSFRVKDVRYVFNPSLVSSFNGHHAKLVTRHTQHSDAFKKDNWKQAPDSERKAWVLGQYEKKVSEAPWNADLQLPILPVLHCTEESIANSICQTGFSIVSSKDEGSFGQGMYFTSSAIYTLPTMIDRSDPVILLCFVIPGNVYPVTEDHQRDDINNLKGKPLKSGYQSHYVVTDQNVCVTGPDNANRFDEVVIHQETQVIPAVMISIDTSNFFELKEDWFKGARLFNSKTPRMSNASSFPPMMPGLQNASSPTNPEGRPTFQRVSKFTKTQTVVSPVATGDRARPMSFTAGHMPGAQSPVLTQGKARPMSFTSGANTNNQQTQAQQQALLSRKSQSAGFGLTRTNTNANQFVQPHHVNYATSEEPTYTHQQHEDHGYQYNNFQDPNYYQDPNYNENNSDHYQGPNNPNYQNPNSIYQNQYNDPNYMQHDPNYNPHANYMSHDPNYMQHDPNYNPHDPNYQNGYSDVQYQGGGFYGEVHTPAGYNQGPDPSFHAPLTHPNGSLPGTPTLTQSPTMTRGGVIQRGGTRGGVQRGGRGTLQKPNNNSAPPPADGERGGPIPRGRGARGRGIPQRGRGANQGLEFTTPSMPASRPTSALVDDIDAMLADAFPEDNYPATQQPNTNHVDHTPAHGFPTQTPTEDLSIDAMLADAFPSQTQTPQQTVQQPHRESISFENLIAMPSNFGTPPKSEPSIPTAAPANPHDEFQLDELDQMLAEAFPDTSDLTFGLPAAPTPPPVQTPVAPPVVQTPIQQENTYEEFPDFSHLHDQQVTYQPAPVQNPPPPLSRPSQRGGFVARGRAQPLGRGQPMRGMIPPQGRGQVMY